MKPSLSVALATYNEEKNLPVCLASIKTLVSEIVVVDGGSRDKTIDIAHSFAARVYRTTNPQIFHINKQAAIEACTGDWVLQLDADELVPEALRQEIISRISEAERDKGGKIINAYYIVRKNFFCGRWMKHGGMWPDAVIRLFRRGTGKFPCKSVHEQIEINGAVGILKNPMEHYTYRTIADYFRKADAYTSLTARFLREKRVPKTALTGFTFIVLKPAGTFFSLYIRHRAFLDGWQGFFWALFSGLHDAQAYVKYFNMKPNQQILN